MIGVICTTITLALFVRQGILLHKGSVKSYTTFIISGICFAACFVCLFLL